MQVMDRFFVALFGCHCFGVFMAFFFIFLLLYLVVIVLAYLWPFFAFFLIEGNMFLFCLVCVLLIAFGYVS